MGGRDGQKEDRDERWKRAIAVGEAKIRSVELAIHRNVRVNLFSLFCFILFSCVISTSSFESFLLIGSECL